MCCRLVLRYFGPKIQHIAVIYNIVAYTLSRLPSTSVNKYKPITRKYQCRANQLLAIIRAENNEYFFPLNILRLKIEQQKELRNINSKLSTYILGRGSSYSKQDIDEVEIICYDSKIYVPQNLCRRVLDWCHFYLNHPGGSRLAKTIPEVFYWKGLVAQAKLFVKTCKICQQFKNRMTIYGHLTPNNSAELKPWDMVHVDLIVPYINSIIQHQPGSAIIRNNAILA